MLRLQGPLAILAIILVFALLHLGLAGEGFDPSIAMPTLMGGIAFILMTCSIILSTRAPFLEDWFGGLDRMYQVHKMCGVLALLFVLPHFFFAPDQLPEGADAAANSMTPSAPLGMIALILLVLSLVIALNRKISYSRWRPVHKVMGLVYVLVIGHFFTSPEAFGEAFGPSIPLLILFGAVGVIAFVYSVAGMNKRTATRCRIEEVNAMERATEIVLAPESGGITFQPGQFAFVEIQGQGWNEPHPFTISSAPSDDKLRFTMKVLGDWTRKVRDELQPGGDVLVRGPYGRFDMQAAGREQVWIAGGIGLTPFLSAIREMEPGDDRQILLVYASRNAEDAIFLDELRERAAELGNITVVSRYSDEGQFADIDFLGETLSKPLSAYDYFMCGPKPMTEQLGKSLKKDGVRGKNIHSEAFEFR